MLYINKGNSYPGLLFSRNIANQHQTKIVNPETYRVYADDSGGVAQRSKFLPGNPPFSISEQPSKSVWKARLSAFLF